MVRCGSARSGSGASEGVLSSGSRVSGSGECASRSSYESVGGGYSSVARSSEVSESAASVSEPGSEARFVYVCMSECVLCTSDSCCSYSDDVSAAVSYAVVASESSGELSCAFSECPESSECCGAGVFGGGESMDG